MKELDRHKIGMKFSKAFSEFTILVYHNIVGGLGDADKLDSLGITSAQTQVEGPSSKGRDEQLLSLKRVSAPFSSNCKLL